LVSAYAVASERVGFAILDSRVTTPDSRAPVAGEVAPRKGIRVPIHK